MRVDASCRAPGSHVAAVRVAYGHGAVQRSIDLSAEDLERAVLVGRYDRCATSGPLFSSGVSRVHLALVRREDGLDVYDTASSHGTWLEGRRVRHLVVRDAVRLSLGCDRDHLIIELARPSSAANEGRNDSPRARSSSR
jgi:hypothetical protein